MINKKLLTCIFFGYILVLNPLLSYGQVVAQGLGQNIQINTRLRLFIGRPSWLIIIRDLDHGQNIPYLYDFTRGNNFWLAFTMGRNYVITASVLQFSPYRRFPYCMKKITNFCHLESNCRVHRGESMIVTVTGDLTANPNTVRCNIMRYPDFNYTVLNPSFTIVS